MNALYIQMSANSSFTTDLVNVTGSLSSDELQYSGIVAQYIEFMDNNVDAGNASVTALWAAYSNIYLANSIIENAGNSPLSASLKAQITGTSKFVRAFYYFNLINMFGAVPLVTSTDYTQTATIPRTTVDTIYSMIIADLTDANSLLSPQYDGSLAKAGITAWAVKALLARVYLYQKDWKDAETWSGQIIQSGVFNLAQDLNSVFLANSSEAIWQLAPLDGQAYTSEGNLFIPNTGLIPTYQVTDTLLHSFETGDKRKLDWTGVVNVGGDDYTYPYKYKVAGGSGAPSEYYMIFRLAEQYLIRAEAEAEQNQIQPALADLDNMRSRAGLPLYSNDNVSRTQADVLLLVEKERQHELFCEWSHRWFDLKRTGRADAVLGGIKTAWKSTAQLYPIPNTEILRNPELVQNPGY